MFTRRPLPRLTDELQHTPAVALLGPRPVGKTTMALEVGQAVPRLYLDLASERDRAKLAQPELYLADRLDKLLVYPGDEPRPLGHGVQAMPLAALCHERALK